MDLSKFLVSSGSLAVGGIVIVVVAYYMIRSDIMNYLSTRKNIKMPSDDNNLLQLRLQAHERMIIFVDRINPSNLLLRLHQQGIEMGALQLLAVNEIKTEFQHNITQQLYLEVATWDVIRELKDDTIAMINNTVKNLAADSPGIELSRILLAHLGEMQQNPYELTIGMIKQDIHKMF